MKTLNPILAILFILFLFGCEDFSSPHQTFSDAVQQIPDVQIIPGAENAALTVQSDRSYSYFRVTINNVERNRKIANGTYYAWCLQMNVPINTGEEYTGVKLYSTEGDRWLNRISYIVNNRPAYERENPELSWREIQVAMWVMLETQGFQLPENFATSYDYNAQYVSNILNDVQRNGIDFKPRSGDITIVITNAEQNEQTIGIERQTAWMFGGEGFTEFGPGWGGYYLWNTGDEQTFVRPLVAGQHYEVGQVTFYFDKNYYPDSRILVKMEVFEDNEWVLDDTVHIYIGEGIPGHAPGLYPFGAEFGEDDSITKIYWEEIDLPSGSDRRGSSYDFTNSTEFYISVHTVVVEEEIHPQETGTVTDIDGNIYQTVKIGNQWWLAENLRVTKYNNGDIIPNVTGSLDWESLQIGAWVYHNNNPANDLIYGKLYNWHAVADDRGLCPEGWYVPSYYDYQTLIEFLGGPSVAGGKLKSTGTLQTNNGLWYYPNGYATNESGWSGLPGGDRVSNGHFNPLETNGSWWSSTEASSIHALYLRLGFIGGDAYIDAYHTKRYGFSVRCIME